MLHGHLPILISRLGAVVRHASHLYNSATRTIELGFYSIQTRVRPERWRVRRALPGQRGRARRSRPLLIHYHIFKNAGSSFEWTLKEAFGKFFHSYDSPSPGGILSPPQVATYVTSNPNAKVIVSHQAVLPCPKIRGYSVISSILIRDPIARIRSIYAFERRQATASPGAQKAKELDFKGYVEWRLSNSPVMFCNFQVHFCSRTKNSVPDQITTERELERAIENLDQIDLVGTVERYAQWLILAQSVLSHSFPSLQLVVARRNVTGEDRPNGHAHILDHLIKELGSDLAERLLECNYLDMRLHQVADALLTRRLAEHGIEIKQRDAYAKAREGLSALGG
jgi:hypothetical protein